MLPKGFVRIRYYGFLANRRRRRQLALARELLAVPVAETARRGQRSTIPLSVCHLGRMLLVETLEPRRSGVVLFFDSS